MKRTAPFIALTALLFIAGCSTTKVSTPKQHPEKYALQVIQIEVPAGLTKAHKPISGFSPNAPLPKPPAMDDLLRNREAIVNEFPIVYAAVGETGINDQTETLTFPNIDEPAKVGRYTKMTIQKVENGTVSCDLNAFNQTLQGMQQTGEVSTPVFKKRSINTEVTLTPGNWISMGGLINEKVEGTKSGETKTVRTKEVLFIRILPPKGVSFAPSMKQPTVKTVRFPDSELILQPDEH